MKIGEGLPNDKTATANERTGWHALAAVTLLLLLLAVSSCGEEDFTVGGPLPTRPPVTGTSPTSTPDDGF